MAYSYNVKAKKTEYKGVEFKSILESVWAQFFDKMGWKWKYEPFLLNGWAPDFKLTINNCDILVEVKPIKPKKNRMSEKLLFSEVEGDFRRNIFDIKDYITDYVLLLGEEPIYLDGVIQLGWMYINDKYEPFNMPYKSQILIDWNKIALAKKHAMMNGEPPKKYRKTKVESEYNKSPWAKKK